MRRSFCLGIFAVAVLGCSSSEGDRSSGKKSDRGKDEPTEVRLDDLRSTIPASWQKETAAPPFRAYQFRLPRAEGDEADALLVVYHGIGGTAKANIERWKTQFKPPDGKTTEEVAKIKELKLVDRPASYLDIEGTFLDSKPGSQDVTPRPGYRMLAVHIEGRDTPYHIKLTGPAKTVEEHKKEFDDWLAGFHVQLY
ncbi:MAG: hypothetical protein HYS12_22870 [Planctomycetes bacterium]|nr:hypothetical protein [Planctomycetota bacterium]